MRGATWASEGSGSRPDDFAPSEPPASPSARRSTAPSQGQTAAPDETGSSGPATRPAAHCSLGQRPSVMMRRPARPRRDCASRRRIGALSHLRVCKRHCPDQRAARKCARACLAAGLRRLKQLEGRTGPSAPTLHHDASIDVHRSFNPRELCAVARCAGSLLADVSHGRRGGIGRRSGASNDGSTCKTVGFAPVLTHRLHYWFPV